jgi:hypothetical protein
MFQIDAKWFLTHHCTVARHGQTKEQIIESYMITEEDFNKSVNEGKPVIGKRYRWVLFFYLKDVQWEKPYYDVVSVTGDTSWVQELTNKEGDK